VPPLDAGEHDRKADPATADKLKQTVTQLATNGYQALGVARPQKGDDGWSFLGNSLSRSSVDEAIFTLPSASARANVTPTAAPVRLLIDAAQQKTRPLGGRQY